MKQNKRCRPKPKPFITTNYICMKKYGVIDAYRNVTKQQENQGKIGTVPANGSIQQF